MPIKTECFIMTHYLLSFSVMRIGKKTKEVLFKPEVTEGLTRLICTCKGVASQGAPQDPEGTPIASPGYHSSVSTATAGRSISITNTSARLGHSFSLLETGSGGGEASANASAVARSESCAPRQISLSGATKDDLSCGLSPGPVVSSSQSSSDQCAVRGRS